MCTPRWSLEGRTSTGHFSRAHLGPGHCNSPLHSASDAAARSVRTCSSASCEDDHRDPTQSTSCRARGSDSTARASLSSSLYCKKTCGHCLSDTVVANSTPARTQLCFCAHERLFLGADEGLSLSAASWEPCMPEANSESSVKTISTCISTGLVLPAQQLEIQPVTAHMPGFIQIGGSPLPYLSASDPVISKDTMGTAEVVHLSGSQTDRDL